MDCPVEGSDEVLCPASGDIDLIAGVDSENVLISATLRAGFLSGSFCSVAPQPEPLGQAAALVLQLRHLQQLRTRDKVKFFNSY